ncbi:Sugar transport protein 8 [Hibiscus syriacus]|uniref:Sugar transport protein 8 n=1 Tax=Hibiscus syriacus TaxID=106335 RepID=A0A6A2ZFN4_HIBSY|nr:Sugar transport protein 8 [Hibiscus syriacus]
MAPAVVVIDSGENQEFEGKITVYVIVCVILAAFGGLMFGYDVGISERKHVLKNNYCKYKNQSLQLFTSCLYLAALIASFIASKVCSKAGRKHTMQTASNFSLLGVVLTSAGVNLEMIIFGRIFLGFGIGFAIQAVPLFLSEIAPARIRGALNITICETPTSLIERNKMEKGVKVLRKIRGVENVDNEFDSIVHACEMARQVKDPFRKLMKPVSRPPLVIAICLQVFQQFTGINAIMFYAPVLFLTVGFGNDAALLSSVIIGLVNVFSTMVSVYLVDRTGRRLLLLEAWEAILVVIMVCIFVMGFAWSWGPLGWLIPSETFPLETRSAGFAFAVSSNMFFTFVIAQAFLSMLCHMQAGIFFFFAAWIIIMGVFTWFLVPETKGVPVDSMLDKVWKQHWFWRTYMADDDCTTVVKVV